MNLGLPSFRQLVDQIAREMDFDPDIFQTFGDYQSLAEYYVLEKTIGPLRSWMDRSWHQASIEIKDSEVHRLIVALRFPIIYGDSGEGEHQSGGKPNTIPVIANTIGAKRRWQSDCA